LARTLELNLTWQLDASKSWILINKGKGNFEVANHETTNFTIVGHSKALIIITGKNTTYYMASLNRWVA
jgi:hypothetical protein